ncbi:MAG: hypothetical protein KDC92_18245, partial [Bacteroidetes bacterium]|nr:hypothetical protein [Bacteroidota bacterium]
GHFRYCVTQDQRSYGQSGIRRWQREFAGKANIQGADSGAVVPVLVPDGSLEFASDCIDLHFGVQNVAGKSGGP